MRKFKYPVAMEVTSIMQYEEVSQQMKEIGIDTQQAPNRSYPWTIVTDYLSDETPILAYINWAESMDMDYYMSKNYNPELFLSLAALSDGSEFFPGEYVCNAESGALYGKVVEDAGPNMQIRNFADSLILVSKSAIRKATAAELIEHFSKKKTELDAQSTLDALDTAGKKMGEIGKSLKNTFSKDDRKQRVKEHIAKIFPAELVDNITEILLIGGVDCVTEQEVDKKATQFADTMKLSKAVDEFTYGELVICYNNEKEFCIGYYKEPSINKGHYVLEKMTGVLQWVEEVKRRPKHKVQYDDLLHTYAHSKGIDVSQIQVIPTT